MTDGLDRLKVLINSSTPIVVMETSEEMHAVNMVRTACSELNMATFEWSIADGLLRSGTNTPAEGNKGSLQARIDQNSIWAQAKSSQVQKKTALSPGSTEGERLSRAIRSSLGGDGAAAAAAGRCVAAWFIKTDLADSKPARSHRRRRAHAAGIDPRISFHLALSGVCRISLE